MWGGGYRVEPGVVERFPMSIKHSDMHHEIVVKGCERLCSNEKQA